MILAELIEWSSAPEWVLGLDSAEVAFWQRALSDLTRRRKGD